MSAYDEVHDLLSEIVEDGILNEGASRHWALHERAVKALGRAMDATAQNTRGRGRPQLWADYEGIIFIIIDDPRERGTA